MTFGQKIECRRKEHGYTQSELAQKVHTTQPYVSRLELGHFNPSMRMIVKIATALKLENETLEKETHFL